MAFLAEISFSPNGILCDRAVAARVVFFAIPANGRSRPEIPAKGRSAGGRTGGTDITARAVNLLNENPTLVALGKKSGKACHRSIYDFPLRPRAADDLLL